MNFIYENFIFFNVVDIKIDTNIISIPFKSFKVNK